SYTQHLENRWHTGFARSPNPLALRDIEDQVGRRIQQPLQHLAAVAQFFDIMAQLSDHLGNGINRRWAIELLLMVIRQVGASRTIILEIVGDSDAKRSSNGEWGALSG